MTLDNETGEPVAANPSFAATEPPKSRWRRRSVMIGGAVAVLGLAGVAAAQVADGRHFGPHFGPRFGGPGMMMRADMTPQDMADMADRGVRHLAIEIDATSEQQDKLRAIVRSLVQDLAPLRDTRRQTMERARTLLTQDKVDRAAIDAFRADQLTRADATSKRIAQAIEDAADVLTPEQRRKLADRIQDGPRGPGGFGPFWRRG